MHTFPCARRRRLLAASVLLTTTGALTLSLLPSLTPVAEAKHASDHAKHAKQPTLQKKQKHVRAREKHVQASLDGESAALTQAEAALSSAKEQLATARAHLAQVNVRLGAARKADAALRHQLALAQQRLADAKSAMASGATQVADQRAAAQQAVLAGYVQGSASEHELESILDGKSLDALTSQEEYGAAVDGLQMNAYQSLQASQVLLRVRTTDVAAATREVAAQEKTAAAKVAQVQSLQDQAREAAVSVSRLVTGRRTAEQETAAAKAHDATQLKALQTKDARLEAQILAQAGHGGNRVVTGTGGLFMSPVANTYITSPYGWRLNPVMHYWGLHDGDDLHAPCGTPEVAVGPGKVISEYYSDVWGNRLFFNLGTVNGASWVAIYNHITAYKAHVGDVVGQGQTLAYAGTTGWSTGCHLHFTLMRNGTAVDPTKLIGLD